MTTDQFHRVQRLALRLVGIDLLERHRGALERRLRRLGIGDEAAIDALIDAASVGDESAGKRFIGLLTTNFTGFFRHPRQFDVAAEHALWTAHRRGTARAWSTAAATGEEPYSLAIALIEAFRQERPPVTILASDIDEDALAVALRAEYGESALASVEPGRRERFFREIREATPVLWRVAPAPRALVTLRAVNLADVVWPIDCPSDVILCRNVLMYLDASYRYSVLERMASLLADDGILILDPAESLGRARSLFASIGDGVYSLARSRSVPRPVNRRQEFS